MTLAIREPKILPFRAADLPVTTQADSALCVQAGRTEAVVLQFQTDSQQKSIQVEGLLQLPGKERQVFNVAAEVSPLGEVGLRIAVGLPCPPPNVGLRVGDVGVTCQYPVSDIATLARRVANGISSQFKVTAEKIDPATYRIPLPEERTFGISIVQSTPWVEGNAQVEVDAGTVVDRAEVSDPPPGPPVGRDCPADVTTGSRASWFNRVFSPFRIPDDEWDTDCFRLPWDKDDLDADFEDFVSMGNRIWLCVLLRDTARRPEWPYLCAVPNRSPWSREQDDLIVGESRASLYCRNTSEKVPHEISQKLERVFTGVDFGRIEAGKNGIRAEFIVAQLGAASFGGWMDATEVLEETVDCLAAQQSHQQPV